MMEPLTCSTAISANEERSFKMVRANCLIRPAMSCCICMGEGGNSITHWVSVWAVGQACGRLECPGQILGSVKGNGAFTGGDKI